MENKQDILQIYENVVLEKHNRQWNEKKNNSKKIFYKLLLFGMLVFFSTSIFIYNTKTKHEVEDQNMTSQTPPSPCKCVEHDTLKNATDECQKTLETGGICDVYSYDVSKYDSGDKKRELYEVVPNLPEVVAEEYLLSNKNEIPFPKYNNFKNEVSFPEERVLEEVTSFYMPWYSCDNCTE